MATPSPAPRRGPREGAHVIGLDADRSRRPGVPMHAEPHGTGPYAGRERPPMQQGAEAHLTRAGLDRPTPVVGTAQPPAGLNGLIRRGAYEIPEQYARHWMLLMLADRVAVLESRLGEAIAGPLESAGLGAIAPRVARNPLPALAGVVVGLWLVKRAL